MHAFKMDIGFRWAPEIKYGLATCNI